ncbi:MAG: autotransporter domain-containing protein [Rhodobiaceae bacterium]|nr:autotransporter domain-containing protein [Rhodobiaceae bacterium]
MRFSISSTIRPSFLSLQAFKRVGLAALAGFSMLSVPLQSAQAGPSDPTSANLIANALPGETTSTSCNSNGFIVVRFMGGSGSSSSVESSTTCTPGGGGSTPPSTPGGGSAPLSDQQQSQLEQDLVDHRLSQMGGDLMDLFADLTAEELEEQFGDFDDTSEITEEEKAALLSKYRSELSSERASLAQHNRKVSDLRRDLNDAKANADARRPQLEADLRDAEGKLANAKRDGANLPTLMGVVNAGTKVRELQRQAEEWRIRSESAAYGRPEYARNMYGAAQARAALAEQELEAAIAAHDAAIATHTADAKSAVDEAKSALDFNDTAVDYLQQELNDAEIDVMAAKHEISNLQRLIRNLESQNQLAGPSGDTFEVLRSRGLEFWSRGGVAFADDTQSGRNQEIEQKEITVGMQGRYSERLLLGIAVSYVNGDNADQTGAAISTDTETFMVAPYLAYQLSEDLALDASGVYGITDVSLTRATTATASYDATTIGAQIGLSMRHKLSKVISLTGRVGQSYVRTDSDGYTDTGGVTIASSDNEQAATSLSGRVNVSTDPDWRWHGALKLRYDTIDPGNGVDRLYGTLSTGLEYNPGPYAVAVQASRSVFRSNYEATGLGIQVRVPF